MKDTQAAVNEILARAALMMASPRLMGKRGSLQSRIAASLVYDKKTQSYKTRKHSSEDE
jgi:hypothetical protein